MKSKHLFLLIASIFVMAQENAKVQQTSKVEITAEAGALFGL